VKPFIKTEIGKPERWLLEAAAAIGLDLSGFAHETTNELIDHSIKRHGDRNMHGAATITGADFDLIPGIVKLPDYAIVGATRGKALVNAYARIADGMTYMYFEEVLASRKNKALRGKTLYKVTRPLSPDEFLGNVSGNGKTDISKAMILGGVQTAGGHPGG